jgi:transcriptional regulator with XRE-family HTH domain
MAGRSRDRYRLAMDLAQPPAPSQASFGPLLRAWRTARGKSQLALATEAGVSSRHLSFVETGRSTPSREMVITLAEALDVPLRDRNALLEAAGYARLYRETPLDAPVMIEVRHALARMLEAGEPNPTLVVNRRYDVLMANTAAERLIACFAPEWRGKPNVADMLLAPEGLKPSVVNWGEVAGHVVHRVRGELAASRSLDREDEALLGRMIAADAELRQARAKATAPLAVLVPIRLRRGEITLDLFTTITTLGTPLDITLQELRIETLFPADARDREVLLAVTRRHACSS